MATAMQTLQNLSEDPELARQAREREDSQKLYAMSLAASEARGEAARQRRDIADLCAAFQIPLTPVRQAELDAPDADLDAIWRCVLDRRCWPGE